MCELLVFAKVWPLTGVSKVDDLRYKRGDVVKIKEDGATWGRIASKAAWIAQGFDQADWKKDFVLLKIPLLAMSKVKALVEVKKNIFPGPDGLEEEFLFRRLRYLDIDATPQQIRNKIGSDFEITVTVSQIRNFIKRKSDDAVFDPGFG